MNAQIVKLLRTWAKLNKKSFKHVKLVYKSLDRKEREEAIPKIQMDIKRIKAQRIAGRKALDETTVQQREASGRDVQVSPTSKGSGTNDSNNRTLEK